MSWDYLISGFLASLIVAHREKKKQQKIVSEKSMVDVQNIDPIARRCEDAVSPAAGRVKETGTNWREKYRDNKAEINPEWYNTEEEFLEELESRSAFMREELMKVVRTSLTQLSEDRDLRLAAAMVYIGYRNLEANYYDCAMKCLEEIMKRNGIDMGTVISIAEQLEEAIESYDKNPNSDREFKISLL